MYFDMPREGKTKKKSDPRRNIMSIKKQRMGQQVRSKCFQCQEGKGYEVPFCNETDCPLWLFRFGESPDAYIRRHGKESRRLFNPQNF
jgi:hypothetical protein